MKSILLFLFVGAIALNLNAQIPEVKAKDSCYLRYGADGKRLSNQYYAEWECGKTVGVIDCNGKLEYDQASNLVYLNNEDLVNSAGANKPFSGQCETCHQNGRRERIVNFVGGKEHGVDTTYYKTGCPQVVRAHIQGVESGQWLYYYDSTQFLAWEMNYVLGQKHGKQIYFKSNGDTTKWENYNNGRLHGIKRSYYPDSKIKREVTYNNGVMEGSFKIYNMEGVVIEEINYKEGKKHEECKYYYDDGKPLKNENWNMGVKNGEFKVFYYQGSILSSKNYKKGVEEGWFMDYYPDSKTKQKILYKKGERIEEHRYDEQGRETYSFGAQPEDGGAEDDEMPTTDKKKKRKR